jgi:hypothetical protein
MAGGGGGGGGGAGGAKSQLRLATMLWVLPLPEIVRLGNVTPPIVTASVVYFTPDVPR